MIDAKLDRPPAEIVDGAKIDALVTARSRFALSRFGAFVRRRAMSSLRYRTRKSRPGEPPSAHRSERFKRTHVNKKTGAAKTRPTSPLRELIAFAVIDGGRAVIIGPMLFRASTAGGGNVPRLLEKGGTGEFITGTGQRKVGQWLPRPYMSPAMRAELPKAPKLLGSRGA